jgi:hypothetical protein
MDHGSQAGDNQVSERVQTAYSRRCSSGGKYSRKDALIVSSKLGKSEEKVRSWFVRQQGKANIHKTKSPKVTKSSLDRRDKNKIREELIRLRTQVPQASHGLTTLSQSFAQQVNIDHNSIRKYLANYEKIEKRITFKPDPAVERLRYAVTSDDNVTPQFKFVTSPQTFSKATPSLASISALPDIALPDNALSNNATRLDISVPDYSTATPTRNLLNPDPTAVQVIEDVCCQLTTHERATGRPMLDVLLSQTKFGQSITTPEYTAGSLYPNLVEDWHSRERQFIKDSGPKCSKRQGKKIGP